MSPPRLNSYQENATDLMRRQICGNHCRRHHHHHPRRRHRRRHQPARCLRFPYTDTSNSLSCKQKNPRVQGTDICDKDSKFSPLKRVKLEDEISELQRERLKLEEEKREASENSELLKAKAAKAIMEAEKADLEAKNVCVRECMLCM